jgi:transposase
MDKIEYCVVIKFFVKEGLTPNEIHSKFIKVYGDSSPLFSTIKKWAAKFKRGRTSLEVDPCKGHPKSATPPEIIEKCTIWYWMTGRRKYVKLLRL